MQTIKFKREPNFHLNQYCILQFKGKFESESQDPQNQQKSYITLGQLKKLQQSQGRYKLQIGIMDLIGKQVKLTTKQLVTQTVMGKDNLQKIVLIKGIVVKKIVFDHRPAPDMERVLVNKREGVNHKMFDKVQQKNLAQQNYNTNKHNTATMK